MCGIVGIASREAVADRSWLVTGRDRMRHRGPDDAGEWWSADGRVGLGHRRLAIVDLSPRGHQPMLYARGRFAIVFNGEIYNFRELRRELAAAGFPFESDSDTEVILAAFQRWGAECLSRLNGMFALAIYDAEVGRLFLARDRAGEKPLYYTLQAGAIRFASELKGLLADGALPRQVDRESLLHYLGEGFIAGRRCILRGFNKLPPAHALTFDLHTGSVQIQRYWQLPSAPGAAAVPATAEPALLEELEQLLEDAVRRQLLADVPVGVLLSGGVDSSLVTAMAVRSAHQLKTFTVRFPGHQRHDETAHARLIAQHFGTQHLELEASDTSPDVLGLLARQFDEPLIDSSMIPTHMVSRLVREHCTVGLGGDGGDELFGGYTHYSRLLRMERTFGRLPGLLREPLAALAGALLPLGFKGRNWAQGLGSDLRSEVPLVACYFDAAATRRLVARSDGRPAATRRAERRTLAGAGDLVGRASRLDFLTYLPEDILVKVDRTSMLHSLEVRAPMLDARLIEFAYGKVPSSLKVSSGRRKILLKKLAARVLPQSFNLQRKQGFSIPLSAWLRTPAWNRRFREILLDQGQRVFQHRFVESVLAGETRGRANAERLFGLVMFELWRREYCIEVEV